MGSRKDTYPQNWNDLCFLVIKRAGNRCEGSPMYPDCRAQNHEPHPVTGAKVVLTVAHIFEDDTQTEDIDRLVLQCQRCHLARDREMHIRKARITRLHNNGMPGRVLGPVLEVLASGQPLGLREIAQQTGLPLSAVRKTLSELEKDGVVSWFAAAGGPLPGRPVRLYWLTKQEGGLSDAVLRS